ncbi:hypothetical protein BKA82DRAFT_2015084 [Pisolithus tinctorius]|nr:hypothetical protein BKA82DRAFT_2015084 [Pisolithus tinctorius]
MFIILRNSRPKHVVELPYTSNVMMGSSSSSMLHARDELELPLNIRSPSAHLMILGNVGCSEDDAGCRCEDEIVMKVRCEWNSNESGMPVDHADIGFVRCSVRCRRREASSAALSQSEYFSSAPAPRACNAFLCTPMRLVSISQALHVAMDEMFSDDDIATSYLSHLAGVVHTLTRLLMDVWQR